MKDGKLPLCELTFSGLSLARLVAVSNFWGQEFSVPRCAIR